MKRVSLRFAALMAEMMMTMMTSAQQNDSLLTDTTMWFNQTHELSGVVVKGRLPKTRVKGDAMRTTVAGTILEKAGTMSDALSKIPSLEAERDGGVKVLGRGEAEVYINGRRVQDMKELSGSLHSMCVALTSSIPIRPMPSSTASANCRQPIPPAAPSSSTLSGSSTRPARNIAALVPERN